MLIGILQCGHTSGRVAARHGDFDDMFRRLLGGHGHEFRTWNVVDMEFPDGPGDAEAWLVTGSKHGAHEDHPFIPPLEDLIRAVRDAGVPMVGVCFGHQIIAQALGGTVEKYAGGWGLGRTAYRIEGLGTAHVTGWHQDQVVELPQSARVVGRSDHCATAALAYGNRIWTIQPHPEFGADVTATYVEDKRGTLDYPHALMDLAEAALGQPLDGARVAALMLDVLEGRGVPQPETEPETGAETGAEMEAARA